MPDGFDRPQDHVAAQMRVRNVMDCELMDVAAQALGPFIESPDGRYLTPAKLAPEWREMYEERAAIREFDGGQPREHAEHEALIETLAAMRAVGAWPFGER